MPNAEAANLRKERNSDTCHNAEKYSGRRAEGNQPATKGQIPSDSTSPRSLEESHPQTESGVAGGRGRGAGNEELVLNGERGSVLQGFRRQAAMAAKHCERISCH